MTAKNSSQKQNLNSKIEKSPQLTAEETIMWLENYRQLMIEAMNNDPQLKKRWLKSKGIE